MLRKILDDARAWWRLWFPAVPDPRLEDARDRAEARRIVRQTARGNVSLRSGNYLTIEDQAKERLAMYSKTY